MKKIITYSLALCMIALLLQSCDTLGVDEIEDPNNPTVDALLNGASETQLQNIATGLEFRHRTYISTNSGVPALYGVFGRELYAIYNSDPNFWTRWVQTTEPLAENDPTFFVGIFNPYTAPYNAVAQGNLMLEALENTDAVSETQKNGYRGFANTIKGFQYLIPLSMQYRDTGDRDPAGSIRIDVENFIEPGPFVSYDEALNRIRSVLDTGYDQLNNAGNSLNFSESLSSGFEGFTSPQGMAQLNRAIAARAAIYAEDWQGALNALDDSFMDLSPGETSMNLGGYHVYQGPPDIFNPLFWTPNQNTTQIIMVAPGVIDDALPNDGRTSKFFERDEPVFFGGQSNFPFTHQFQRYSSNTDPIPFIRNEELILIYAEANAQLNNSTQAVNAIDIIRNTWGVEPYTGPTDTDSLIDEILFQRRYSLFGEGHRWIDMRRYDRLDEIDTGLDGGRVPTHISRPLAEINFEDFFN